MEIIERDKTYIAGTYKRFPVCIVRGKGSLVYDEAGKEYIDMGSGIGVTSFGVADDVWAAAVTEQISRVQHMSNLYYTEPCSRLAEMLCARTGMKKVFFSNSGAEANECAIKVARKYAADRYGADDATIVTLRNGFHGRTLTTLAATGQDHYHELFNPLTPGFSHIDAGGDLSALEESMAAHRIAGVMIECIQGEGGVLPVPDDFVRALDALCKKYDVLFLVDEVQTGNGRTGKLYSYEYCGVTPDVVSTAKGLAGGLPLGATLIGDKAKDVLGFGDHGSTFGGNPVCCAAACSILSRIDEDLLSSVRKKGEIVSSVLDGAPGVESLRGRGLMWGIKTVRPAADVVADALARGVLCLTAKDRVRLLPALNIDEDVLRRALAVLRDVCEKN